MFIGPLQLTTPIAAFNSAMIVEPDLRVINQLTLDDEVSHHVVAILEEHDVSTWVYQGEEWYVRDLQGPHTQHEASVVAFQPVERSNLAAVCTNAVKIVGVSDDAEAMAKVEVVLNETLGARISATASQPYYLDITHPMANKGNAVDFFARHFEIPSSAIATIGDAFNDVSMFERSGLSIAMGNALSDVKAAAKEATTSNDDDGFAHAIERFILS